MDSLEALVRAKDLAKGDAIQEVFISGEIESSLARRDAPELSNAVQTYLIERRPFYTTLERLHEWSETPLPNPNDYGKDAVTWLRCEKATFYGLGLFLAGAPIVVASGGKKLPLYTGGAIMMVGGVLLQYARMKTETLKYESEDAKAYVQALGKHFGAEEHFTLVSRGSFREETQRYLQATTELLKRLKEEELTRTQLYDAVTDEKESLQRFVQELPSIVEAIRKKKKATIPKWGGGIAGAVITAQADLDIENMKSGFSEIKNTDRRISRAEHYQ